MSSSSSGSRKKKKRGSFVAASGKWEKMIRAPLKRNHPLCLLKTDFFLTVNVAQLQHSMEKLAILIKRSLHTHKKILLETLPI